MAHSCPDCSQACYCGGDIDDILFEDSRYELFCTHCDERDDFENEDYGDYASAEGK